MTPELTFRLQRASLALFIIAFFPALMAAIALSTGMRELRPLIYGGAGWTVMLVGLGLLLRRGSATALWLSFGVAAITPCALVGYALVGGGKAPILFVLSFAILLGAKRLFILARDVSATSRDPAAAARSGAAARTR